MELVYAIVIVLHAQAGNSRVAVMAPGHYTTIEECRKAAELVRGSGVLNTRCIVVPKGEQA